MAQRCYRDEPARRGRSGRPWCLVPGCPDTIWTLVIHSSRRVISMSISAEISTGTMAMNTIQAQSGPVRP
jgi:hypothetical protein